MKTSVYSVNALCFSKEASLCIEVQGVRLFNNTGEIIVTGNLGQVAYEAALVAKTLIGLYHPEIYNHSYHLHFAYHSTKKEGASWGVACFVILSFLCGKTTYRSGVAATGELDIAGNVKAVNYMDEKLAAWARSTCDILFVPKDNRIKDSNSIYQISNIYDIWSIMKEMKK